jgi:uncharacterized protein YraI
VYDLPLLCVSLCHQHHRGDFMRRKLLLSGLVLLALMGVLWTANAQGGSVTLFTNRDYIALYVPASAPVDLRGLQFSVVEHDGLTVIRTAESQFPTLPLFQSWPPADTCFVRQRFGAAPTLPDACARAENFFRSEAADADVWWYDHINSTVLDIGILAGSSPAAICSAANAACDIAYIAPPPTITPIPSATPLPSPTLTPTLPPPRVLFIVDASFMMNQPLGNQTRWEATLEKVAQLLGRQVNREVGILVYGPPESHWDAEHPLGVEQNVCDDYEWRLAYQPYTDTVDLDSIGLSVNNPPGGAIALERALFDSDGANIENDPTITTVIMLIGGLAPEDGVNGCNLSQGDLEDILANLADRVSDEVRVHLVGISETVIEVVSRDENVITRSVGSEDELVDQLEFIFADADIRDEANPNVDPIPPTPTGQAITHTPQPTPAAPLRGTPIRHSADAAATAAPIRPTPTVISNASDTPTLPPTATGTVTATLTPTPSLTLTEFSTDAPVESPTDPPRPTATDFTEHSRGLLVEPNTTFDPPRYGRTNTGVNVRSGPGIYETRIGALSFNTQVTVTGTNETGWWCFVNNGWVYCPLITFAGGSIDSAEAINLDAVMIMTLIPPTPIVAPTNTPQPADPNSNQTNTQEPGGDSPDQPQEQAPAPAGPSISISAAPSGSSHPCDGIVNVTLANATGSVNAIIHVWNQYYQGTPEGSTYPVTLNPGNSSHVVTLGGASEDHKTHRIWITSDIGNSNEVGGLECPGW